MFLVLSCVHFIIAASILARRRAWISQILYFAYAPHDNVISFTFYFFRGYNASQRGRRFDVGRHSFLSGFEEQRLEVLQRQPQLHRQRHKLENHRGGETKPISRGCDQGKKICVRVKNTIKQ